MQKWLTTTFDIFVLTAFAIAITALIVGSFWLTLVVDSHLIFFLPLEVLVFAMLVGAANTFMDRNRRH